MFGELKNNQPKKLNVIANTITALGAVTLLNLSPANAIEKNSKVHLDNNSTEQIHNIEVSKKVIELRNNLPVYTAEDFGDGGLVTPKTKEVEMYGNNINASKFLPGTTRVESLREYEQYFNKGFVEIPVSIADSGTGAHSQALKVESQPSTKVSIMMEFKAVQKGWLKVNEDVLDFEKQDHDVNESENYLPLYDLQITIKYPKSSSNRAFFVQGQYNSEARGFVVTPNTPFTIQNYGGQNSETIIGTGIIEKK